MLVFWAFLFSFNFEWILGEEYQVTFRDDFNGTTLDLTQWNPTHKRSEVNGELEFYTPDALSVANGKLIFTANKSGKNGSNNYTSGRIDTRKKFEFTYGKIEIRAKLPKGKGIWGAFWMCNHLCLPAENCPDHWPPALNVFDSRGDQPNQITATTHFLGVGRSYQYLNEIYQSSVDLSVDFHVYALKWDKKKLTWFVDGKEFFSVDNENAVPTNKMQIVLNVAIGGPFSGLPDESTKFPAEMMIDYVEVRQIDGGDGGSASSGKLPDFAAPLLGIIFSFIFVGIFVAACCVWRKRRHLRIGDMRKQSTVTLVSDKSQYSAYFIPEKFREELAVQHYVNLLELPSANLILSENVLGKGEYGLVRKGTARGLRGQPRPTVVAVKSAKNPFDVDQRKQLLDELKIMTKAGRHLNIVNLLGAVVKGETLLLLEYCSLGSLLTYLKTHRGPYFFSTVDATGDLASLSEKDCRNQQHLLDIHKPRQSFPEENFDNKLLTTFDLINFAHQIARGMVYLTSRSIIHRDLAARNVLVADCRILKLADFGMARQELEYVASNQRAALPVKWMSPEAITRRVFCEKTDVWSFGILLWEIFTLGETPYHTSGLSIYIQEFVSAIITGFRMERPTFCPTKMRSVMTLCWKLYPEDRPVFSGLEKELRNFLSAESEDAYVVLDTPYLQFNLAHQDLLDQIHDTPYRESGAI